MTVLKVFILLLAAFLMRPSALGQSATTISIYLCLFSLYIHLIQFFIKKKIVITRQNTIILFSFFIMWVYLFSQSGLNDATNFDFTIKAVTSNLLIVISAALTLSDLKANKLFFKWFIYVLAGCAASYLITVTLLIFIKNFESLYLFTIPVKGYEDAGVGKVYFPFTVIYSFMGVGNVTLPRLLGLFREAGIYQAFLIWGYFSVHLYEFKHPKWIKFFLFAGVIGTFSTAGIGIFFATSALKYLLYRKFLKGLILMPSVYLLINYAPFIGLASKSVTHSTSITDRTGAISYGLNQLWNNPWGIGMNNALQDQVDNAGISLLSASYMIGVIGMMLVFFVFTVLLFGKYKKKYYIVSMFPIFITMLFSEPIMDAPLVYLMLMATYFDKEVVVKETERIKKAKRKKLRIIW